jgi:hypothetical protein
MDEGDTSWRRIIWREWRNSDDPQYVERLFDLVAGSPATAPAALTLSVLGAVYGALWGLLAAWALGAGQTALPERTNPGMLPFVAWGALLGAVFAPTVFVGLIGGLSWRVWLFWLFSASSLSAQVWVLNPDHRDPPYGVRDCVWDSLRWALLVLAVGLGVVCGLWVAIACLTLFASAFGAAPGGACCLLWVPIVAIYLVAQLDSVSEAFEQFTDAIFSIWPEVRQRGFCWGAVMALGAACWLGLLGGSIFGWTASGPIALVTFLASCPAIAWQRARRVSSGVAGFPARWGCWWWRSRPSAAAVENAVRHLGAQAWSLPLSRTDERRQNPGPLPALLAGLDSLDWVKRFAIRHTLVGLGGEVVDLLVGRTLSGSPAQRREAAWLIESIALRTWERLGPTPRHWLCLRCLVHCSEHRAMLPRQRPCTYYGCRSCKQSQEVRSWTGRIVAVLAADRAEVHWQEGNTFWVNWLRRRELFDFERVEIVQATDEQVEGFLMQLRHRGAAFEIPPLSQVPCTVAPGCELSGNTMRNLRFLFGNVA